MMHNWFLAGNGFFFHFHFLFWGLGIFGLATTLIWLNKAANKDTLKKVAAWTVGISLLSLILSRLLLSGYGMNHYNYFGPRFNNLSEDERSELYKEMQEHMQIFIDQNNVTEKNE